MFRRFGTRKDWLFKESQKPRIAFSNISFSSYLIGHHGKKNRLVICCRFLIGLLRKLVEHVKRCTFKCIKTFNSTWRMSISEKKKRKVYIDKENTASLASPKCQHCFDFLFRTLLLVEGLSYILVLIYFSLYFFGFWCFTGHTSTTLLSKTCRFLKYYLIQKALNVFKQNDLYRLNTKG